MHKIKSNLGSAQSRSHREIHGGESLGHNCRIFQSLATKEEDSFCKRTCQERFNRASYCKWHWKKLERSSLAVITSVMKTFYYVFNLSSPQLLLVFRFIFPFTCLAEVAGTHRDATFLSFQIIQLCLSQLLCWLEVWKTNLEAQEAACSFPTWWSSQLLKQRFPYLLFSFFSAIGSCTFHFTWILVYSNFPLLWL